MIKNGFPRTITALAVVLVAFASLLTGCIYDKELDYLYTVGIEDYSYTGEGGNSLSGPQDYLSGLDIADRFTITAEKEADADAQARSRFEAEMNKVDPAQLRLPPPGARTASAMCSVRRGARTCLPSGRLPTGRKCRDSWRIVRGDEQTVLLPVPGCGKAVNGRRRANT